MKGTVRERKRERLWCDESAVTCPVSSSQPVQSTSVVPGWLAVCLSGCCLAAGWLDAAVVGFARTEQSVSATLPPPRCDNARKVFCCTQRALSLLTVAGILSCRAVLCCCGVQALQHNTRTKNRHFVVQAANIERCLTLTMRCMEGAIRWVGNIRVFSFNATCCDDRAREGTWPPELSPWRGRGSTWTWRRTSGGGSSRSQRCRLTEERKEANELF